MHLKDRSTDGWPPVAELPPVAEPQFQSGMAKRWRYGSSGPLTGFMCEGVCVPGSAVKKQDVRFDGAKRDSLRA